MKNEQKNTHCDAYKHINVKKKKKNKKIKIKATYQSYTNPYWPRMMLFDKYLQARSSDIPLALSGNYWTGYMKCADCSELDKFRDLGGTSTQVLVTWIDTYSTTQTPYARAQVWEISLTNSILSMQAYTQILTISTSGSAQTTVYGNTYVASQGR